MLNKLDEIIVNYNYKKIKELTYVEKLYVCKYLTISAYRLEYDCWNEADIDIFMNVNIYLYTTYNKLSAISHAYKNNLKIVKTINVLMEANDEDFKNNIFSFIPFLKPDVLDLIMDNKDFYNRLFTLYTPKEFMEKFYTYYGNLTKTDVNRRASGQIKEINNFIYLLRFVHYNVEKTYINTIFTAWALQNYPYHLSTTINLSDWEKETIINAWTDITRIRGVQLIYELLDVFNGAFDEKLERKLLSKIEYKDALRGYNKIKMIEQLETVTNHSDNKLYLKSMKFAFSL